MTIDAYTALYGVFGNPVRHSKGPLIHNACFQHYHKNAVYLAFETDNIKSAVDAMKTVDIKGASITIPHKSSILDHIDSVDQGAQAIGAVNTIVNNNGRLMGYNTDWKAAILPLTPLGIKGKKVCIIGAGGAAQAVTYGIKNEKGSFTILNRTSETGQLLASKFGGQFVSLQDDEAIAGLDIDILINTTPVGMYPKTDATPFPLKYLRSDMIVMDIIYNPLQTTLLTQAKNMGCKTINGLSMFLYQAAAQFKLWTDINPDITIMKEALTNEH